jgi:hypothetical protein
MFLDVEASKVMVLQETVKKQIHDLLHKIKAGLRSTVGKVRDLITSSHVQWF